MAEPFHLPIHTHEDAYHGYDSYRPVIGEEVPYHNDRKVTEFVEKVWGGEEIIINNPLYCGKILTVESGKHTSYHYHVEKDETFYILEGTMVVYIGNARRINRIICLNAGEKWRIRPEVYHTIACPLGGVDLKFIEFSTHDSPSDSYRADFPVQPIIPGGMR